MGKTSWSSHRLALSMARFLVIGNVVYRSVSAISVGEESIQAGTSRGGTLFHQLKQMSPVDYGLNYKSLKLSAASLLGTLYFHLPQEKFGQRAGRH